MFSLQNLMLKVMDSVGEGRTGDNILLTFQFMHVYS